MSTPAKFSSTDASDAPGAPGNGLTSRTRSRTARSNMEGCSLLQALESAAEPVDGGGGGGGEGESKNEEE